MAMENRAQVVRQITPIKVAIHLRYQNGNIFTYGHGHGHHNRNGQKKLSDMTH